MNQSPPLQPALPSINTLARTIHADYAHWWTDLKTGERLQRDKGELCMLMVSEVSEAMEGERKNLLDDHLPTRRMAEVELADVLIRILDYSGAYGVDLEGGTSSIWLPEMPANKAAALLQIAHELTTAGVDQDEHWRSWRLCRAVRMILRYAEAHGYDVDAAVQEKHAYNLKRADHKPAARLAEGGKQW